MHILITNDDGITAPGLLALVQELRGLGEISVVAPDKNWSVSGHVKTLERPLRVKEAHLLDGVKALACDGSPSDCVALALLGLLPQTIDLVVSGINPNANMGHDLTYSGTVTAALEASIWGVAGIAVSVDHPDGSTAPVDYTPAARAARQVIERMVVPGQKPDFLLNVNVPWLPEDQIRGFHITRQGTRIYRDVLVRREDPRGRPYYWFGGDIPTGLAEEGTDFGALADGYVSITPLDLDLTNHDRLETLRPWGWNSNP